MTGHRQHLLSAAFPGKTPLAFAEPRADIAARPATGPKSVALRARPVRKVPLTPAFQMPAKTAAPGSASENIRKGAGH